MILFHFYTALEQAMRLHLMAGERQSKAVVQVQKSPMVAGWAHVSQSGCSQKTWVALEGDSLTFATKPGLKVTTECNCLT